MYEIETRVCMYINCVAPNPLIDLLKRQKPKVFHWLNTVEWNIELNEIFINCSHWQYDALCHFVQAFHFGSMTSMNSIYYYPFRIDFIRHQLLLKKKQNKFHFNDNNNFSIKRYSIDTLRSMNRWCGCNVLNDLKIIINACMLPIVCS